MHTHIIYNIHPPIHPSIYPFIRSWASPASTHQPTESQLPNQLSCRGSNKKLEPDNSPYDERAFSPLHATTRVGPHLTLVIYISVVVKFYAVAQGSDFKHREVISNTGKWFQIERRQVVFFWRDTYCISIPLHCIIPFQSRGKKRSIINWGIPANNAGWAQFPACSCPVAVVATAGTAVATCAAAKFVRHRWITGLDGNGLTYQLPEISY